MNRSPIVIGLSQAYGYISSLLPAYISELQVQANYHFKTRNSYVTLSSVMLPSISLISHEWERRVFVGLEKPMDFTSSAAWARNQCSFIIL